MLALVEEKEDENPQALKEEEVADPALSWVELEEQASWEQLVLLVPLISFVNCEKGQMEAH